TSSSSHASPQFFYPRLFAVLTVLAGCFPHKFVVRLQSETDPNFSAHTVNPGLLSLETSLVEHVVEGSPLGGFFTLILTPAFVSTAKLLHRNLLLAIQDAAVRKEFSKKIVVNEQAVGCGL